MQPLSKRVYEFPKSLPFVIIDMLERGYVYGFGLLQVFITLFPIFMRRTSLATSPASDRGCAGDHCASQPTETTAGMEFLPLMLTSVYCSIGLVWAFLRLSVLYLKQ